MIEDFRSFDDGSEFSADICIIGAGAAGITMARELSGGPNRVVLLESGGFEFEEETQDLYRGNNIGLPYVELDVTRLRYFGGSTNHWGGFCMPMGELDFQERPWIPYSGWPITRAEMEPYYRKAARICELGEFVFDARRWKAMGIEPPDFDVNKTPAIVFQMSPPVRFGETFREDLKQAENVRVLLHANVVDIASEASAKAVDHVRFQTLTGKTGKVRARLFVLACGGIENVRVLLNSTSVEPNGLGNRHDLVGRFFMDHPHNNSAGVVMTDQPDKLVNMFLERWFDQVRNVPLFRISDQVQEQEQILNANWRIHTDADRHGGVPSARKIWSSLKSNAKWPDGLGEKVWRVVSDFDDVARNTYREFVLGQEPVAAFRKILLAVGLEQSPNPDSRITLAPERDALGLRVVNLDWRLTELEMHTFRIAARTAAGELARTKLGRVRLADWLTDEGSDWPDIEPSDHHMGTTRMAGDPKKGVVEKNCRVHGVENLYIAGSSVFPTVGQIGVTITIVALAVRLADHLRGRLA